MTTLKELTKRNEALDEGIFVSMLGLEYAHNDEPAQVKRMIVAALRFSGERGLAPTSTSAGD